MSRPWFKFFGLEYLSDPKTLQLTGAQRSCWLTLLCLTSQSEDGEIKFLSEDQLLVLSGVSMDERGILDKFVELGMIRLSNGNVTLLNWTKRQYSEGWERVKRYRSNAKVTQKSMGREEKIRKEKITHVADATQNQEGNLEENSSKTKPFVFQDYLDGLFKSPQRHIQIIGLFWKFKGFSLPSQEAVKGSLTREMRPAKALIGYTDDQIIKTMEFLDNDPKRDYVWTLETVGKRINNVINNRN
jgi:hypothetical protein